MLKKQQKRYRRRKRVRARIKGTKECPRFSVFRSNQHLYVQLIDDEARKTLIGLGDIVFKKTKMKKIDLAKQMGASIAEKALLKKIKRVVFDRGGYKYHGRVKAVAEGARQGGLKF